MAEGWSVFEIAETLTTVMPRLDFGISQRMRSLKMRLKISWRPLD
jgi:hypothetical protein